MLRKNCTLQRYKRTDSSRCFVLFFGKKIIKYAINDVPKKNYSIFKVILGAVRLPFQPLIFDLGTTQTKYRTNHQKIQQAIVWLYSSARK